MRGCLAVVDVVVDGGGVDLVQGEVECLRRGGGGQGEKKLGGGGGLQQYALLLTA